MKLNFNEDCEECDCIDDSNAVYDCDDSYCYCEYNDDDNSGDMDCNDDCDCGDCI